MSWNRGAGPDYIPDYRKMPGRAKLEIDKVVVVNDRDPDALSLSRTR